MTPIPTRPQTDRIMLENMQFYGNHGVFTEETRLGQRYTVSVVLHLDVAEAGRTDELVLTIDYAKLYAHIQQIVERETYRLIEAVAQRIATVLLETYALLQAVTVRVTKPHPPFAIFFDGVTVEIFRPRLPL